MLEDESGRLRLIGPRLAREMLATGCIISVMGTENANGDFEVIDVRLPDLAPQPARWAVSESKTAIESGRKAKKQKTSDDDEEMGEARMGSGGKIAIVSGLGITGSSAGHSLQIDLLLEYLLGEALDPASQSHTAQISRLIIAGNSLALNNDTSDSLNNTRKVQKKYGYDSSSYNPAPTAHLDAFLASLLPSMPVTLIPGASDPANVSIPQQPVHAAMFPHARAYAANPPSVEGDEKEPGWFDAVTNPWEGEVEGWRVLGTGGQNLDDLYKYVDGEDRVKMMENLCRWRCVAPTAPDTLCKFSMFGVF